MNGLLPCGLVYMAIAGAIGTANVYYGIAFMVLFGLGTLPMMLAISLLGNLMSMPLRNRINKVIPYVVVVVGAIFILRGLSLGIPYLSPPAEKLNPEIHMKSSEMQNSKEAIKAKTNADIAANEAERIKAVDDFTKAANQNNSYAECNIGFLYFKGYGVKQNYIKAFEFYTKAAEKNHSDALTNLGELYKNGKGVK